MSSYWVQRADLRMKETHVEIERNLKQILQSYEQAISDIDESMQHLLYKGNFETLDVNELLSIQTTKQEVDRLYGLLAKASSKAQIKVLKNQITQLAYKARISRLDMVKSHIETRIATLNGSTEQQMTSGLSTASETMYNKTVFDLQQEIGYAFPFQRSTDQMINTILNSNWSGKHWSDRLWTDNRKLADNLVSTLSQGISQGKSYYTMARELKENMTTGEFEAVRLIRTEATFVANQAKLIALENSGVDEFEYIAVLDARTSEICQEHDGAIVTAKQAVFGLTLPPLHPNCRSTFVARIPDEMKANLKRMAVNPVTGEKEQIPRSMTYKEWKQSLYEQYGRAETDIAVKKVKNARTDSAQYELYQKTVGIANMPESIEAFRELKYTKPRDWWLLKGYKNAIQVGDISPLVGIDVYRSTVDKIESDLVGVTASDGVLITGYKSHFIDRVIGQIEAGTIKSGYRSGVKIEDCLQSLLSPGKIKTSSNGESRVYAGLKAAVTLNPLSGTLIQTNPRSEND